MGARIEMQPNRRFIIDGVTELSGAVNHLMGDRIEAFSYLVAGLITGGEVTVRGCSQDRLVTAISMLSRMGAEFEITDTTISAKAKRLSPATVETDTHSGFMTDWQSPMVALFTQCEGLSTRTAHHPTRSTTTIERGPKSAPAACIFVTSGEVDEEKDLVAVVLDRDPGHEQRRRQKSRSG